MRVLIVISILFITSCGSQDVYDSDDKYSFDSFNDELLGYIYELRIQHPYIVYSQAVVETGGFKSVIFTDNNNLFGMRLACQRPTTAVSVNRHHAVYTSWRSSVLDYAIWQSAYARNLTEDEYYEKLKSVYAKDVNYIKKIKQVNESCKLKTD